MSDSGTFKFFLDSGSPEATLGMAKALGKMLRAGDVLALEGGLGGGKTLFVRGLALGLGTKRPKDVRSPTFSLIQEHSGKIPLCHADLYRLKSGETLHLGLEEYWEKAGPENPRWVTAIEWADRAERLIPKTALRIKFEILSPRERRIHFSGRSGWKKIKGLWKKRSF